MIDSFSNCFSHSITTSHLMSTTSALDPVSQSALRVFVLLLGRHSVFQTTTSTLSGLGILPRLARLKLFNPLSTSSSLSVMWSHPTCFRQQYSMPSSESAPELVLGSCVRCVIGRAFTAVALIVSRSYIAPTNILVAVRCVLDSPLPGRTTAICR